MRREGTVSFKFNIEGLRKQVTAKIRKQTADKVWAAMKIATKVALNATPVWTGETRANYRWSVGRKGSDYTPHNVGLNWRAPIFPVSPGNADSKTLSALEAMKATVYLNPFQKFVLYNNTIYENGMTIRDLEYGQLTGTPHMMLSKARQALQARLGI